MHVLVTGGAGFLGSHLSEACLARGWTVTAADNFADYYAPERKRSNVEIASAHTGFTLVEADLAVDPIEPLLDSADIVFHLASQPGVRSSWGTGFPAYISSNVTALQRLLDAAKERPLLKFIFASSSSVYGNADSLPTSEATAPAPVSPYGATKAFGEQLCRVYQNSHGVPVAVLRYFTVFGPRQRPDMAFWRLIDSAMHGAEVTIHGDGTQTRDFTYVADAVAGTVAAAEHGAAGSVFNIAGGSRLSLQEVVEAVADEVGSAPNLRFGRHQAGDAHNTYADTAHAREELGFRPSWDFSRGLAEQVQWQAASSCAGRKDRALGV